MAYEVRSEIDSNYEAFVALLPEIIQVHFGQYALLHGREIIGYYGTALEAATEGFRSFGEGAFSVQEVTDETDNLGFYSYAGGTGQA